MQNPDLWVRLESYAFPRGYAEKLAGMSSAWPGKTHAIMREYLRFIYLAVISDGPVTPSVAVDRAWHLHLTYTRDYWETFCPQALQQDLHHDPCDGPESQPIYDAQYAATLALYEAEFGEVAPMAHWPTQANWKHVWWGGGIAALGGAMALPLTWMADPHKGLLLTGLAVILGGGIWAIRHIPETSGPRGAAGCGGAAAGCGGGGCGG